MVRRRVLWSIALVVVGCSDWEVSSTTVATTGHTIHVDGPLRKIDTGGDTMSAALRGHLAIVNGCVVQQRDDGQITPLLWPLDVRWDKAGQAVEIPVADIKTYWPDGEAAVRELSVCQPNFSVVWVAGEEFDVGGS